MKFGDYSLAQLFRLKKRISKQPYKDATKQQSELDKIQRFIDFRQHPQAIRCALPKKKQRKLGLLPEVAA